MTGGLVILRDKIERAYRNGERLHLDVDQVHALVGSPLFALLAELVAEEFKRKCAEVDPNVPQRRTAPRKHPNSDPSAFSGERTETSGSSHGTMTETQAELVASAERRRALAAVQKTGGRRGRQ